MNVPPLSREQDFLFPYATSHPFTKYTCSRAMHPVLWCCY